MLPDRVSNPGPLTYESGALPIALRGPAKHWRKCMYVYHAAKTQNLKQYGSSFSEYDYNKSSYRNIYVQEKVGESACPCLFMI